MQLQTIVMVLGLWGDEPRAEHAIPWDEMTALQRHVSFFDHDGDGYITVAEDYRGKLAVYKVDIDNAQETASSFGILQVPTCIFFKSGKEMDRFYGSIDLRAVKGHVDKVIA